MKKAWVISIVVVLVIIAVIVTAFLMNKKDISEPAVTPDTSSQPTTKNNGSVEQQQSPSVQDGISSTQAGNIAVQQYGGTVKNVATGESDSKPIWKVDITGSPQGEINVEVAQSDGTVLGMTKVGSGK